MFVSPPSTRGSCDGCLQNKKQSIVGLVRRPSLLTASEPVVGCCSRWARAMSATDGTGMGSHEARKAVSSKVDPLRSPMRADLADSIDGAIDGSVRIGRAAREVPWTGEPVAQRGTRTARGGGSIINGLETFSKTAQIGGSHLGHQCSSVPAFPRLAARLEKQAGWLPAVGQPATVQRSGLIPERQRLRDGRLGWLLCNPPSLLW